MPLIEINRAMWGSTYKMTGPYEAGASIQGKLHGKPVSVDLDKNRLLMNNILLPESQYAVLFDAESLGYFRRLAILIDEADWQTLSRLRLLSKIPVFGTVEDMNIPEYLKNLFYMGVENVKGQKS